MIERVFLPPSPRHSDDRYGDTCKTNAPLLKLNLEAAPGLVLYLQKYFAAKVPAFPAKEQRPHISHMTNDWKARLGMVYSTDPNFKYDTEEAPQIETLAPNDRTCASGSTANSGAARPSRSSKVSSARIPTWGTGPPAQNPLRRGRGSQGRRNHHPGRPPRPGGRNPRQSGLQMQKRPADDPACPHAPFRSDSVPAGIPLHRRKTVRAQYYSWGADALRCAGNTCVPRTYGSSFPHGIGAGAPNPVLYSGGTPHDYTRFQPPAAENPSCCIPKISSPTVW